MPPLLSIVSPVYKAAEIVDLLVDKISEEASKITSDYEIILVEDAGPDQSWSKIKERCLLDKRVKGVKFSRNFGQHYAITAGLSIAKGEWIIVMDCDLQDNPSEIPNLYNKAMEGFDMVLGRRTVRMDGFIKRFLSKAYYKLLSYLTDTKQDHTLSNFGIYHSKVIHAILMMKDYIRYVPSMSQWVGFRRGYLDVQHQPRSSGKSSYTFNRLVNLAIQNIISYSDKPLRLTVRFGLILASISILAGIYFVFLYLRGEILVLGYTSLILSICFFSGIIIFILGIIGLYVGKTFEKVKDRPLYIIEDSVNVE